MILAIDVGGTKTLLAVFDGDGKVLQQAKFLTPKEYPFFISELAKNIADLTTKRFACCVIAMPGRVDRKNGTVIAFGNFAWQNIPIVKDLSEAVKAPIYLENDSKLAGLSEAHLLPGYKKVLYLTVSTGISGGLIVNGKISPLTEDAEYGQMLLEHDGRLKRWEKFASGKAIVAKFGKKASEITDERTWYVIARNIAIGLIDVIVATTPDAVVIGGGVGSHFAKFEAKLNNELKNYENDLVKIPPLFGAQRAETAVIYGCYLLAKQKL